MVDENREQCPNQVTMNPTPAQGMRSLSTRVSPSSLTAIVTAILVSLAIVRQNFLVLATVTTAAFALLFPVEVSLGLLAILLPFDQVLVLESSGTSLTWVGGAVGGTTLVLYGLVSRRFKSPPWEALSWGLFVLWTAASVSWAIDPATSLTRLPTVATLFAIYMVSASFLITNRELSRIILLAAMGGAVAASIIIFQFAHHISIEGRASLVIGQLRSNPNDLAGSLLLPFSLTLGCVLSNGRRLERAGMVAALGLISTSMLLLMSRGAFIALGATVFVYLFRRGIHKRMLVTILLLVIPLLFMPDLFYQRLAEASSGRGTGRYDIWLVGMEIIKRYPIIGTGLANFTVAYPHVAGYAHVFHSYARVAHNVYLEVCAESGLIGLALFLSAICFQMRAVHAAIATRGSADYSAIAIEAAYWGQLVRGLSGNILWNKPFWFSLILLALVSHARREPQGGTVSLPWDRTTQTA